MDNVHLWSLTTMNTHLLCLGLLLDLLQVAPQIHSDLVFGAQQSLKHLVSGHTHFLQSWLLHTLHFLNLEPELLNLRKYKDT